jgi:hypothetical protein
MNTCEQGFNARTQQAEAVYEKLQNQQAAMETLQQEMQNHITMTKMFLSLAQTFSNTFKHQALQERADLQTKCEEQRKAFKWDMEQISQRLKVTSHNMRKSVRL